MGLRPTSVNLEDCFFTNQQTMECSFSSGAAHLLLIGVIVLVTVLGVIGIIRSYAPARKRRQRGVEPGQGNTLHHHGGFGGNPLSFGSHNAAWTTSNDPQKHAKAMMPKQNR